jgi:uncharacterized protein (UPF0548 family)
MLFLRRPSSERIQQFLDASKPESFSYSQVGATRGMPPDGFTLDHSRVHIGTGQAGFDSAKEAIRQWKMFDLGWLSLSREEVTMREGQVVTVLASHYGFWSLNACRIVYVVDEVDRFGFAYGTLRSHAEIGEERFMVELRDGAVWYEILAFSRPRTLARLGYPLSRALQKRFARDSLRAMTLALAER